MIILVADDNPTATRVMEHVLAKEGHDVRCARSVAEAERLLGGSEVFDVVMTDFLFPDGTGVDVLAAARRRTRYLPVICLTGLEVGDVDGFDVVLSKPVAFADLRAAIKELSG